MGETMTKYRILEVERETFTYTNDHRSCGDYVDRMRQICFQ